MDQASDLHVSDHTQSAEASTQLLSALDIYIANLRQFFLPWIGGAFAGVWIAWNTASAGFMVSWVALYGMVSVGAAWLMQVYAAQTAERRKQYLQQWVRSLQLLNGVFGLVWGGFLFCLLPDLPLFKQLMLTWIVVISGAVAAISLPIEAVNLRLYLASTLVLSMLAWVRQGEQDGWLIAFSLGLLAVIYDGVGRRYVRDVRQRVELSNALAQSNAQLLASNVNKTRLVVEASHDLRQPVHALGLMLDRINVYGARDDIERRLREVQICVTTVSDMLIDMLDLSRLESGEYLVDIQPVDIGMLLRELDLAYGSLAQGKQLTWAVAPSRGWVLSDPGMVKRILNNLVSNAIKYTSSGGVGITCRSTGDQLEIHVLDTGRGIPAESLDTIFNEYVRLDDASQEPGYGIGLAVVKRMVDLLGHRITVTSTYGKGTRFTLSLTRISPPVEAQTAKTLEQERHPVNERPWEGKLIIFIENDEQLRSAMSEVLTDMGAQVVSAADVSEVLFDQVLYVKQPDLVISDMHLGITQNGLMCIASLRKEFHPTPIPAILLTGDLSPELQTLARQNQVRIAYKPVRPSRLRELISDTLSGISNTEPMPL